MRLLAIIAGIIECALFPIQEPDSFLGRLKGGMVHPLLRSAFDKEGFALPETSTIVSAGGGRWTIETGQTRYTIRARKGGLFVYQIRRPVIARCCYGLLDAWNRIVRTYHAIKGGAFLIAVGFWKRTFEHPAELLVNIGAGPWYQRGWKVLDHVGDWYSYPRIFVDFPYDLTSKARMPFEDNSVDLFYSEHVFEHIRNEHCQHALGEVYRTLRVGGGLRMVVPDADLIYEHFRARNIEFFREWMIRDSATLEEAFLILVAHPRERIDEKQLRKDMLGLSKTQLLERYADRLEYDYRRAGEHINWFTFAKLERMLTEAGFSEVRRSSPQESRFTQIKGAGFDTRPTYSLHVDAIK